MSEPRVDRLLREAERGLSAEEEDALVAALPSAGIERSASWRLRDRLRQPDAPLSVKRIALMTLAYLGEVADLRAALQSGKPTLQEAALDAIGSWKVKGLDPDLRALAADPHARDWIRDHAEDLLG
jgi:hypothetical protein